MRVRPVCRRSSIDVGRQRSVLSEAELLSPSGRGELESAPERGNYLRGGGGIGTKIDLPTGKSLNRAQGPKEDGSCSPYR